MTEREAARIARAKPGTYRAPSIYWTPEPPNVPRWTIYGHCAVGVRALGTIKARTYREATLRACWRWGAAVVEVRRAGQ